MFATILPALARTLIGVLPSGMHFSCAMCAQNLATSGQNGLIEGLRWSMLMLLAAPALMIGGFVWMLWRAHRRLHPKPAAGASAAAGGAAVHLKSSAATGAAAHADRQGVEAVSLPAVQHPA